MCGSARPTLSYNASHIQRKDSTLPKVSPNAAVLALLGLELRAQLLRGEDGVMADLQPLEVCKEVEKEVGGYGAKCLVAARQRWLGVPSPLRISIWEARYSTGV